MAELVPAYHARDFVDAQLVKGLLVSHGLHPVVPGDELNDEFGVAARTAGTSATTVLVPAAELARAQVLVAEWKEQPSAPEERSAE